MKTLFSDWFSSFRKGFDDQVSYRQMFYLESDNLGHHLLPSFFKMGNLFRVAFLADLIYKDVSDHAE